MHFFASPNVQDFVRLGPPLVGMVFIFTAAIKAAAPQIFQKHLQYLEIPLGAGADTWTWIAAALEAAWGMSLILSIAPAILFPATAILLVLLAGVTWWSIGSGRTSDCGCYGGFFTPSLWQTISLNGVFAFLCVAAWMFVPLNADVSPVKLTVALATGAAAAAATLLSQHLLSTRGWPLIDANPLRENVRWRHEWAAGTTESMNGEVLVAFLGPSCSHCAEFVRIANAIVQAPDLPPVIGVVSTSEQKFNAFIEDNRIQFPVARIPSTLIKRLVDGYPTIAVVHDNEVKSLWPGVVPPEFSVRVRKAFFPGAAATAPLSTEDETANVG